MKPCPLSNGTVLKNRIIYPNAQQWPMKRYLEWLAGELQRREVFDIRINTEPDPADIEKENFDAVLACTGSHEKRPPIDGANGENVW